MADDAPLFIDLLAPGRALGRFSRLVAVGFDDAPLLLLGESPRRGGEQEQDDAAPHQADGGEASQPLAGQREAAKAHTR